MENTSPTPRRSRRKDARPGEIASAALELFVSLGFQATRMQDIARQAGVAKGTVFRYFPSKNELFKAVVIAHIGPHIDAWQTQVAQFQGPTAQLLLQGMLAWWQQIGCRPAGRIARLFMLEVRHIPELAAFYQTSVINPGRAVIRAIIQRGVASGEFRAVDDAAVHAMLVAPMLMLAATHADANVRHILLAPQQSPQNLIQEIADLLVSGLHRPQGETT